jgi:hypothetical protein
LALDVDALLQLPSLIPQLANFLQQYSYFVRQSFAEVIDVPAEEEERVSTRREHVGTSSN